MNPSRTINKIHFDDLSPSRFEDLCLAMVYRLNRWEEIYHYGRKGKDKGIDIHAIEKIENTSQNTWFIQCKNYKKISKKDLQEVVDKTVKKNLTLPDIQLLVTACDVEMTKIEFFKEYANKKGIKRSIIWTASVLETKLYTEHHDLLFAYFGVSLTSDRQRKIATIRRNIQLKKKIRNDFLLKPYDFNECLKRPYKKFNSPEVIIRSINDNTYPEIEPNREGISPWFRVPLYNIYHNGIEVILRVVDCIFDKDGFWDILKFDEKERIKKYSKTSVYMIGKILFENIVDHDLDGDEYNGEPHIFCEFKNNGEPYEEIVYSTISKESDQGYTSDKRLDSKKRKELR